MKQKTALVGSTVLRRRWFMDGRALLSAPTRSQSGRTCGGLKTAPERRLNAKTSVPFSFVWVLTRKLRLTSTWDSDVTFGSFSSPTETDRMDSSGGQNQSNGDQRRLKELKSERSGPETEKQLVDLTLTLTFDLLALQDVLQLPLIVSSGHVQADAQRLHEPMFYFAQLRPDSRLEVKKHVWSVNPAND